MIQRFSIFIVVTLMFVGFVAATPSFSQDQEAVSEAEDTPVSSSDLIRLNQSLKKLIDENHALLTQSEVLQEKLGEFQEKSQSQESWLHALTAEKAAAQKKIKDLGQALEMIKKAQVPDEQDAKPIPAPAITMNDMAQMFSQLIEENDMIRQQTAKTHHSLAYLLLEEGRHDDAAAEFSQVVNLLPRDAAARYNLAFVCEEYLKDYRTALEHYRKYLALAPDAADAASVKLKISQLESAEKNLLDAGVSVQNGGRNEKQR